MNYTHTPAGRTFKSEMKSLLSKDREKFFESMERRSNQLTVMHSVVSEHIDEQIKSRLSPLLAFAISSAGKISITDPCLTVSIKDGKVTLYEGERQILWPTDVQFDYAANAITRLAGDITRTIKDNGCSCESYTFKGESND